MDIKMPEQNIPLVITVIDDDTLRIVLADGKSKRIKVSDFLKTVPSGEYQSAFDDSQELPVDFGGIKKGTTIGSLNGNTFSKMWDEAMIPTVLASINIARGVTLISTISNDPNDGHGVEVGTILDGIVNATYEKGNIKNGDGSIAGIVGDDSTPGTIGGIATKYIFTDTVGVTHDEGTNSIYSMPGSNRVVLGNQHFSVKVSHHAGDAYPKDNKDTHDSSFDTMIANTDDIVELTTNISGKYRVLVGVYDDYDSAVPLDNTQYTISGKLDKNKFDVNILGATVGYTKELDFKGKKKFVIAYPNTIADITYLHYLATLNSDILGDALKTTETYASPNGDITYTVFVYNQAIAGAPNETIKVII